MRPSRTRRQHTQYTTRLSDSKNSPRTPVAQCATTLRSIWHTPPHHGHKWTQTRLLARKKRNQLHPLSTGEILVVTPMAWTQLRSTEAHRVLCIDCYPGFTRFMLRGIRHGESRAGDGLFLSKGTMAPSARALLDALIHVTHSENQSRMQSILNCFLQEVLLECRVWEQIPSGLHDWHSAVSLMHDDLNIELRRDIIAQEIDIHPNHLSRICKKFSGKAFSEYVCTIRMMRACSYLRNSTHTIAAIAEHAGYNDETHFRKRFKLIYGHTPTQWRKKELGY